MANPAFNPIPYHCASDGFSDNKPQFRLPRRCIHHHTWASDLLPTTYDVGELCAIPKPEPIRQHRLDCQFCAALGSARGKDGTTGARAHTGAEPVHTMTTPITRLKCTLGQRDSSGLSCPGGQGKGRYNSDCQDYAQTQAQASLRAVDTPTYPQSAYLSTK